LRRLPVRVRVRIAREQVAQLRDLRIALAPVDHRVRSARLGQDG
jgi:hypothetical protein